jgi:serine/threonine protein kinase
MTISAQKIRDYAVLGTLGQNREGGRITHLAQAPDGEKVVIKEFRFRSESKWEDYNAIAREIEILKTLEHPRIPKFLESFETEQGACLVQEYIDAPNLDQKRTFTTEQVQRIAQNLQSLTPPLLHRDIKPGNLLLDADHNLYLVDFGFSRIGLEDVAVSSMVRGTTGFMPPEQMLGLDLTKASDLYSVGATLICLMLGIPSGRMAQLMDIGENRLKFSDRLTSDIDPHFVRWLKRMTEPRASERFADAKSALEGLVRLTILGKENRSQELIVKEQENLNQENLLVLDEEIYGLCVKKVDSNKIIWSLKGEFGYQSEHFGFAFEDYFYFKLDPVRDKFIYQGSCIPIVKLSKSFKKISTSSIDVRVINAAKELLFYKAKYYEHTSLGRRFLNKFVHLLNFMSFLG